MIKGRTKHKAIDDVWRDLDLTLPQIFEKLVADLETISKNKLIENSGYDRKSLNEVLNGTRSSASTDVFREMFEYLEYVRSEHMDYQEKVRWIVAMASAQAADKYIDSYRKVIERREHDIVSQVALNKRYSIKRTPIKIDISIFSRTSDSRAELLQQEVHRREEIDKIEGELDKAHQQLSKLDSLRGKAREQNQAKINRLQREILRKESILKEDNLQHIRRAIVSAMRWIGQESDGAAPAILPFVVDLDSIKKIQDEYAEIDQEKLAIDRLVSQLNREKNEVQKAFNNASRYVHQLESNLRRMQNYAPQFALFKNTIGIGAFGGAFHGLFGGIILGGLVGALSYTLIPDDFSAGKQAIGDINNAIIFGVVVTGVRSFFWGGIAGAKAKAAEIGANIFFAGIFGGALSGALIAASLALLTEDIQDSLILFTAVGIAVGIFFGVLIEAPIAIQKWLWADFVTSSVRNVLIFMSLGTFVYVWLYAMWLS